EPLGRSQSIERRCQPRPGLDARPRALRIGALRFVVVAHAGEEAHPFEEAEAIPRRRLLGGGPVREDGAEPLAIDLPPPSLERGEGARALAQLFALGPGEPPPDEPPGALKIEERIRAGVRRRFRPPPPPPPRARRPLGVPPVRDANHPPRLFEARHLAQEGVR